MNKIPFPKEGIVVVTYRCNAKCHMCNTWQYPSKPEDEIKPSDLESLPTSMVFCNVTGYSNKKLLRQCPERLRNLDI